MASDAIVLDSGALSALAEASDAIRVALKRALIEGSDVLVPTVVVAESFDLRPLAAVARRSLVVPLGG